MLKLAKMKKPASVSQRVAIPSAQSQGVGGQVLPKQQKQDQPYRPMNRESKINY
jgi:hypothetical protein